MTDAALVREMAAGMKGLMDAEMERAFFGAAPHSVAPPPLTMERVQDAINNIHGTPKVIITKDLDALLNAFGAHGWTAMPIKGEPGYRLRPPTGGRPVTAYESEFLDLPGDTVYVIDLTKPRLV